MQEEIRSLQASDAAAVDDEAPEEQTTHRVSSHNLESIHERYNRVLDILREERCSMANAFQLARCPAAQSEISKRSPSLRSSIPESTSLSPATTLVQYKSWSRRVANVCNVINQ